MQLLNRLVLLASILPLFAGCGGGRTALYKAEKLEREGRLDEAVMRYAEAMSANPGVGEYRVRFLKVSERAARVHLKRGEIYLAAAKYDEALREFQTASTLDPSLEKAFQMGDLVMKMKESRRFFAEGADLERERKMREALSSYKKAAHLDPEFRDAKEAVDRLLKSRRSRLDGFELNLKSTNPITLKFRDARIKEVFNILSQLSGINFIFDEGVRDQNVTVFLENATFYQALEILTGMNKLGRKVLNESTIIVYSKTPEKEKQYEDLKVQTFPLNKLDAKKAVNLIRTMIPAKKIYVNEDTNALVMRDTPEAIEVARKILEANDIPDAELVLEVEIIELSKNNSEDFGLALSKYAVSGQLFNYPGIENPISDSITTGSTTATSAANLAKVFTWGSYAGFVTVPSATFNFAKTIGKGQTLSNPRIRVKNREKAKFTVGQRIPITTTSTTTVGGTNVNVQYVDVGVKLNAEPVVQLDNDISIKVSLEVSGGTVRTLSDNITQVVDIKNRNLDTVLTLKDGETSIIGGLLQRIDSDNRSKPSIVGDIPVIGTLLTHKNTSNEKTELVLAITPHLVRGITVPDEEVASFWSGKEDDPSVTNPYASFVGEPDIPAPQQEAPSAALPGAPMPQTGTATPFQTVPLPPVSGGTPPPTAQPGAATTVMPGATVPQNVTPPPFPTVPLPPVSGGTPPPTAKAGAGRTVAAAGPTTRISLYLGAPVTTSIGQRFSVTVSASNATDLYNAPFVLSYDPLLVDYAGGSEGDFLKRGGSQTLFQASGVRNSGQVRVGLGRTGDTAGANGSGILAVFNFTAKTAGSAKFGFLSSAFTNAAGIPIDVTMSRAVVEVKQPWTAPTAK